MTAPSLSDANAERHWHPAQLWISFRCQQDCVFCGAYRIRASREPFLRTPEVRRALELARSAGNTGVTFLGGEPTLHPELPALIGHARQLGFDMIHVVSNGRRLATPGYLEGLVEQGLTNLGLSIHAHCEQLGDELSRVEGGFRQQLAGLRTAVRMLRSKSLIVSTNTVIQRANQDKLPDIIRLLQAEGIESLSLYLCMHNQNSRQVLPKLAPLRSQLEAALAAMPAGRRLRLFSVPLCLVPNDPRCRTTPHESASRFPLTLFPDPVRRRIQRAFAPAACRSCTSFPDCAVPERRFLPIYGNDWMLPRR